MKTENTFLMPNSYLCFALGALLGGAAYAALRFVCLQSLGWPVGRLLGSGSGYAGMAVYFGLYVLFCWGMVSILFKSKMERFERRALRELEKKVASSRIISKRSEIETLKALAGHGAEGLRIRSTAAGQTFLFLLEHCLVVETSERVMEIFGRRMNTLEKHVESSYNMLRYVAWAIPSLGFIGTVLGIGNALSQASLVAENLEAITVPLGMAFDTTLIALVESMVLMFLIHNMQHKEESLLNAIDLFCQEKLIINLRLE